MHLQLENLHKSYLDGEGRTLHILRGVDLRLEQPGQTAAIVGASGTGKSTLLHLIGLLDQPDQGRVLLDDKDLSLLSRDAQARYRNTQLGFIFQFHQLLQDFSALENVMMPALVQGQSHSQSRKRASELLEQVGLGSACCISLLNSLAANSNGLPSLGPSPIARVSCWRTSLRATWIRKMSRRYWIPYCAAAPMGKPPC